MNNFAEDDLESPGYEYLRSYENMINLHAKLLLLNYQKEFCLAYKCPSIHRFYFSLPSNNPGEQRFLFTCLCAWLIKDKCQMNLQIEPGEYEDLDVMLAVIIEALRLITDDKISYPNQNRLKRGFGPEVIWLLNILADRALELVLEEADENGPPAKIRLAYKQSPTQEKRTPSNSIMVGQPFVGGGLTTRPLGNYIIDDKSLLLNGDDDRHDETMSPGDANCRPETATTPDADPHEWYKRVESSRHLLESVGFEDHVQDESLSVKFDDWSDEIEQLAEAEKCVQSFLDKSRPSLETTARLIDRQLQLIDGREKYLQVQLRDKLDDFIKIWRTYSDRLKGNMELLAQVDAKADKFESLDNKLQQVHARIESRRRELNDGTELDELKMMIEKLRAENKEYDMQVGLLLAVYFKLDAPP